MSLVTCWVYLLIELRNSRNRKSSGDQWQLGTKKPARLSSGRLQIPVVRFTYCFKYITEVMEAGVERSTGYVAPAGGVISILNFCFDPRRLSASEINLSVSLDPSE